VPADARDYFRARAKRHAYDLVMRELKAAGISRAELARRLGKGADRVSKMLGGPANWTIITLSDLLFAINGGVPKYGVDYPLDKPARNFGSRQLYYWRESDQDTTSGKSFTPMSLKSVPPPTQEKAD
jgi:hypothetical protein